MAVVKPRTWASALGLAIWLLASVALAGELSGAPPTVLPVKDMVTMIDLGAKKCIPCRMMAPILSELEQEYRGRAAIVFIDVWQHKEQATKFGIAAIPTQIFYDGQGKEVLRHEGFMAKADIVAKLRQLGVQ